MTRSSIFMVFIVLLWTGCSQSSASLQPKWKGSQALLSGGVIVNKRDSKNNLIPCDFCFASKIKKPSHIEKVGG